MSAPKRSTPNRGRPETLDELATRNPYDDPQSAWCHLAVQFDNGTRVDYMGQPAAARRFADAAIHVKTTIDDNLAGVTRPLPCQQLWSVP